MKQGIASVVRTPEFDRLFDEIARVLSPSAAEFDEALRRGRKVGQVLERDRGMAVAFSEIGGSCGKKTATAPLGDADLFVYLQPGSWISNRGKELAPATVLRLFEDRVEHAYRPHVDAGRVEIRRQHHSLRIQPLGAGSIGVDVVPLRWDGNSEGLALLPDRTIRGWRPTSVRRQHALLDELDQPNHALRRAIRLMKAWRDSHRLALRSYALEILVLHAAYNGSTKHPRTLVKSVLEFIAASGLREPVVVPRFAAPSVLKRAAVHVFDPAVADNNVADNVDAHQRNRIVRSARHTLRELDRAYNAFTAGRDGPAERRLARAFGIDIR